MCLMSKFSSLTLHSPSHTLFKRVHGSSDLLQEDEEEAQKKGHERDNDDNEEDDPFARLIRSAKDVDKDDPMLDQTFKSTSVLPSSPVTCSSGVSGRARISFLWLLTIGAQRATPHLSDTDAISQLSQSMPELRIMGSDTPITEEEDRCALRCPVIVVAWRVSPIEAPQRRRVGKNTCRRIQWLCFHQISRTRQAESCRQVAYLHFTVLRVTVADGVIIQKRRT